jgi:ABC-type multidrug transport system fused ATPase/permease subunit
MWDDIWSIVWFFFWSFALISYLFALFAVVSDLFRDDALSGGWKAVWLLCLVFVPFLTVLVYLVARGRGMAERSQRGAMQAQRAADEYIRGVAGSSPADEITKAKALLDAGTITPEEYEQLKGAALRR